MGIIVIETFGTGVLLASLSTTITDITPNLESVGPLSQEIELKNAKNCSEGRTIQLEIKSKTDLMGVFQLIKIKLDKY